MNASELAQTMLEWEVAQKRADELKAQIEAAVLEIGATQVVGNVRASYSGGRKVYNYRAGFETAVADGKVEPAALNPFVVVIPETTQIDYTAACKTLKLESPFTQSAPSVAVKLQ